MLRCFDFYGFFLYNFWACSRLFSFVKDNSPLDKNKQHHLHDAILIYLGFIFIVFFDLPKPTMELNGGCVRRIFRRNLLVELRSRRFVWDSSPPLRSPLHSIIIIKVPINFISPTPSTISHSLHLPFSSSQYSGAINRFVCICEFHHFLPHYHIDTKTFRRV